MTQAKIRRLTYSQEPIAKIGETGGTIVYIFPGGKACVKKGKKRTKPTQNQPIETQGLTDQRVVGDRLVQAGVINQTQLEVAMYDQTTTNLGLSDVLIARGWVDQKTLEKALSA